MYPDDGVETLALHRLGDEIDEEAGHDEDGPEDQRLRRRAQITHGRSPTKTRYRGASGLIGGGIVSVVPHPSQT